MTNSFAIQNLSADGVEQAKKALAKLDNDNAKEILGDAQWAVMIRILKDTIYAHSEGELDVNWPIGELIASASSLDNSAPFTRNDGGRAASGRKGSAGDCGVRAMAIALGRDYDECYKELAQANKDAGKAKSMRRGIMKSDFEKVLARYGWVWCPAPKFDGRKARCSDMPKGAVIARQAKHFVAVIDGQPHDTWDCSEKMVYGYWRKA